MTRRTLGALSAATALAVLLGGCSTLDGLRSSPRVSVSPQPPPPGSEALSTYYAQSLAWTECGGAMCTNLKVPLDYAKPGGPTIEISVVKVPAARPSKRIGSLVVNPGGPGGSGVDNAGPLLGHVSTQDAARDMDVLRAALGEEKLTYLGKSYGTFLGATYAGLFPKLVGRMVLDGVVAPDLTAEEINLGQAKGFEGATREWAAYCVSEGGCPLGDSVDTVMQGLRDFLRSVDATPIGETGDTAVPKLTEGWASLGIAAAMYDHGAWQSLVDAMRTALSGNGTALLQLADQYADRNPGGHYAGNIMEVIYAVNCLDKPDTADLAERQRLAEGSTAQAPTWGPYLVWSSLPCGFWKIPPTGTPQKITAAGSDPIVVIGTTRDPATPYEWSVRLRDQLASASLITFDGDGHTAYTRSNACVDDAVDGYYLEGTVPKDGLRC